MKDTDEELEGIYWIVLFTHKVNDIKVEMFCMSHNDGISVRGVQTFSMRSALQNFFYYYYLQIYIYKETE